MDDQEFQTRSGPVPLPLRAAEVRAVFASFLVPAGRVLERLPPGLEAVSAGGRILVTISGIEYVRMSIGPYNEAIVMVPVRYAGPWGNGKAGPLGRYGLFVTDISVTTDIANDAGREIWGFPKFVSSIRFEDAPLGRWLLWRSDEEGEILSLNVSKVGAPMPLKLGAPVYTEKSGEILRARLRFDLLAWVSPGPLVKRSFGRGAVGLRLGELLHDAVPVLGACATGGKGLLEGPEWSV